MCIRDSPKGYYTHITYNDNAMVNVMNLLRCLLYTSTRIDAYGRGIQ